MHRPIKLLYTLSRGEIFHYIDKTWLDSSFYNYSEPVFQLHFLRDFIFISFTFFWLLSLLLSSLSLFFINILDSYKKRKDFNIKGSGWKRPMKSKFKYISTYFPLHDSINTKKIARLILGTTHDFHLPSIENETTFQIKKTHKGNIKI